MAGTRPATTLGAASAGESIGEGAHRWRAGEFVWTGLPIVGVCALMLYTGLMVLIAMKRAH
jgi:hypothetical protein